MTYFKVLITLVSMAMFGALVTDSIADWGFWVAGAVGASFGYWMRGGSYSHQNFTEGQEHAINPANGLPMMNRDIDIQGNPFGTDKHM